MSDKLNLKTVDGIALALHRDMLEEALETERKISDLEIKMIAMARKRGMTETEIESVLRRPLLDIQF